MDFLQKYFRPVLIFRFGVIQKMVLDTWQTLTLFSLLQLNTLPCQKTQQDSGFHNFDADPVSSLGVELFT